MSTSYFRHGTIILAIILAPAVVLFGRLSAVAQEGRAASSPAVWVADPCVKVDPQGKLLVLSPLDGYKGKNAVWDAAAKAVNLRAARNEYVSFQVMVEGGPEGLENLTVTPSGLASSDSMIAAANFATYREFYTEVKEPSFSPGKSVGAGWFPDALIPTTIKGYETCAVAAGATQGLWVDIYVPKEAKGGEYTGKVRVEAEGREAVEIEIRLTVYDFALPAENHLRWRIGYNENLARKNEVPFDRRTSKVGQEFLDLELKFYRLCRAHRVTPTTHYTSPLPDATGKGGDLAIDWASYDKRFGRYLDGSAFDDGVAVNIFSLPVNPQSYDGWPSSTRYFARIDPASFRKALELTVKHWDEMGWDLKNTFVYVADEPREDRYSVIKDHCRIIEETDPRIHRTIAFYTVFGENGPNVIAEFRSSVNHWEIAGDYMLRKALDSVKARGDWVGIYQGSEPFEGGEALDGDGLSLVTWPWIAWMYTLDTLFIYNSTEWNTDDIWTQSRNHGWVTSSQGVLFYPGLKVGVKEALPSMRLKQMRMGMQDYEYMWLLAQAGKANVADAIVRRIIEGALEESGAKGYGDKFYGAGRWERDPAKWYEARREMAEGIVAAKAQKTDQGR